MEKLGEATVSRHEPSAVDPLEMLASAVAGHVLRIAGLDQGEPAWTDGSTVYLDTTAPAWHRLQSVAVQASLVAAGSLTPDVMQRLARRPKLARRYLSLEGRRALAELADVLPAALSPLVTAQVPRTGTAADSLVAAESHIEIGDPPEVFGVLRPRKVIGRAHQDAQIGPERHAPRRQRSRELQDLDGEDDGGAEDVTDPFSSPVGGGGALGSLLKKLMSGVRQLGDGGTPGADTPSHKSRSGVTGRGAVVSSNRLTNDDAGDDAASGAFTYPEWDVYRAAYRPAWCTVHEEAPDPAESATDWPTSTSLRRPLARLGVGLTRTHRQFQGDDIDIDAVVEARVETLSGSTPDESVYLDNLRRRRDLGVLLLLDVSGSVAELSPGGLSVHDQQRSAATALMVALHDLGDRVAMYAFNSQGRSSVSLMPIKHFDDPVGPTVMRKVAGLRPNAYSRLGAAIRHGGAVLGQKAGTSRRLLVVLSDGLAYDHGYERAYGAADARRALAELRRSGTGCLCLTIGADTNAEDLRRVFGSASHATIPRLAQLPEVIGPLFRSALLAAEVRRRI